MNQYQPTPKVDFDSDLNWNQLKSSTQFMFIAPYSDIYKKEYESLIAASDRFGGYTDSDEADMMKQEIESDLAEISSISYPVMVTKVNKKTGIFEGVVVGVGENGIIKIEKYAARTEIIDTDTLTKEYDLEICDFLAACGEYDLIKNNVPTNIAKRVNKPYYTDKNGERKRSIIAYYSEHPTYFKL